MLKEKEPRPQNCQIIMRSVIALLFLCLSSSLRIYAANFEYDGMWFELTSAGTHPTCALTMPPKGYKFSKRFVIPSTVKYKGVDVEVNRIKDRSFAGAKKIKTIVIPSSVTVIEEKSFAKDRTSSYVLGYDYSVDCDSLIFEDGDKSLEFMGRCENRNCNYPNAKYMYLGRNIETKYKLYSIEDEGSGGAFHYMYTLMDLVIGEMVTYIPKYAFKGLKELRTVRYGQKIKMIGDYAFSNCKLLNRVLLPHDLTILGFNVFDSCESLTSITFDKNIKKVKFDFTDCDNLTEINCLAPIPPELRSFEPNVYFNATLYVPIGSIPLYQKALGWKDFISIKEVNQ